MKEMISCSKIIIKKRKAPSTHDWLYCCIVECMASDLRVQYHAIKVNAPCKLLCRNGCSSCKDENGPFQYFYISKTIISLGNNNSSVSNDISCIILSLVVHPKIAYPIFFIHTQITGVETGQFRFDRYLSKDWYHQQDDLRESFVS
jgi:hypothetical protein